jgi:hypothetical protein
MHAEETENARTAQRQKMTAAKSKAKASPKKKKKPSRVWEETPEDSYQRAVWKSWVLDARPKRADDFAIMYFNRYTGPRRFISSTCCDVATSSSGSS